MLSGAALTREGSRGMPAKRVARAARYSTVRAGARKRYFAAAVLVAAASRGASVDVGSLVST
ncbi:hypothetical protein GCM10027064_02860 [Microbacterium petrolearium]